MLPAKLWRKNIIAVFGFELTYCSGVTNTELAVTLFELNTRQTYLNWAGLDSFWPWLVLVCSGRDSYWQRLILAVTHTGRDSYWPWLILAVIHTGHESYWPSIILAVTCSSLFWPWLSLAVTHSCLFWPWQSFSGPTRHLRAKCYKRQNIQRQIMKKKYYCSFWIRANILLGCDLNWAGRNSFWP